MVVRDLKTGEICVIFTREELQTRVEKFRDLPETKAMVERLAQESKKLIEKILVDRGIRKKTK